MRMLQKASPSPDFILTPLKGFGTLEVYCFWLHVSKCLRTTVQVETLEIHSFSISCGAVGPALRLGHGDVTVGRTGVQKRAQCQRFPMSHVSDKLPPEPPVLDGVAREGYFEWEP